MELGDILKQARQKAGLTQAQVAERAGVPAPYLCRLEKGHGDIWDVFKVHRIADVLGLNLTDLMRELAAEESEVASRQPVAA